MMGEDVDQETKTFTERLSRKKDDKGKKRKDEIFSRSYFLQKEKQLESKGKKKKDNPNKVVKADPKVWKERKQNARRIGFGK